MSPQHLLVVAAAQREVDTVLAMRTTLTQRTVRHVLDVYKKQLDESVAPDAARHQMHSSLRSYWDKLFSAAAEFGQVEAHSTLHYETNSGERRDFLELTGGVVSRSKRIPSASDGGPLAEAVSLCCDFVQNAPQWCKAGALSDDELTVESIFGQPLDFIAMIVKNLEALRKSVSPRSLISIVEDCFQLAFRSRPSEDDLCAVAATLLDACIEVAKVKSTLATTALASVEDASTLELGRRFAAEASEILSFTVEISSNLEDLLQLHAHPDKSHQVDATDLTVGRIIQLVLEQVPACYRCPTAGSHHSLSIRVLDLGKRAIQSTERYHELQSGTFRHFSNLDTRSLKLAMCVAAMRCVRMEGTLPNRLDRLITEAESWGISVEPAVVVERLLLFKELVSPQSQQQSPVPSVQTLVDQTLLLTRTVVENRPRSENLSVEFKNDFQTVHRLCVEILVALDAINDAYLTVVTHKYHGLGVTKEVIAPLVRVLGERGDCRALNLVDLCTLYCGNKIDLAIVGSLFRMCEVAGDHHRAKALLSLLKEIIPGFLTKAPAVVLSSLKRLKVPLSSSPTVTGETYHLFSALDPEKKIAIDFVPNLHKTKSGAKA